MSNISQNKIQIYRSLFRARTDIYARYWTNFDSSKSGYTPVYKLKRKENALTDEVIKSHLEGKEIVGIYPLFPDNTCHFLAIDFDKHNWQSEANQIITIAQKYQLAAYLEKSKSGNGGHVWLFFSEAVPAYQARTVGKLLLSQANLRNSIAYDRMFPSQDEHTGKGYGNLICLPLQGQCLQQGTTMFVDSSGTPLADQWLFLESIQKIPPQKLESLIRNQLNQTPQRVAISQDHVAEKFTELSKSEEEKPKRKIKTTQTKQTQFILGSQIYIPETFLPDSLYKFLKKELNITNPKFYEMERRGYSTWQTPRKIENVTIESEGIAVPMGFLDAILKFCDQEKITVNTTDNRNTSRETAFKSKLKLKPPQQKVAAQLLKQDRVILEAKPGFGKTMVALYCMKRRNQKTLIIVHTKTLLHQWLKRIETWFENKKEDVGIIGDNKWQVGNKVTVASYQTLARRDLNDIAKEFGLIIIDECHHVPAKTLSDVVKQFPAKYVLGLTATAYRRDKLEKLMHFYISIKVIKAKSVSPESKSSQALVKTKVITKKTNFIAPDDSKSDFTELGKLLIQDKNRNQLIVDDVVSALNEQAKCLILTERIDHCETLLKTVRSSTKGIHAAVASGRMTKKNRQRIATRLKQDRFQLLVATGKLIGEGFDWSELTHLFLAYPFSWKGKLVQYVGRVQRQSDGKDQAFVYDYLDYDVFMLRAMYFRRLRTYRELKLEKDKLITPKIKHVSNNQLSLF